MSKEIQFDTGFADAEILEYRRNRDDVTVLVQLWNDRKVAITFADVVGIKDIGTGDISEILEVEGSTTFIEKVLSQVYEQRPATHPYHEYHFLNLDDEPCLRVVAAGIDLSYT